MANWYGTSRSNYVRIKDMDGLIAALDIFGGIDISEGTGKQAGFFCLLVDGGSEDGGWPSFGYAEGEQEDDADIEFDPAVHICPYMEDDQILVMMSAGAEKLRYITGTADAFNAKGEMVCVTLDDIYRKAADKFGVPLNSISPATY